MTFADDALKMIECNPWEGNVRQLLSAIRRAVIMADGSRITCDDLGLKRPESRAPVAGETSVQVAIADLDLRQVREAAERQAVISALARSDSNIARAAELLGISRPTLYDLMHRLGIKQ